MQQYQDLKLNPCKKRIHGFRMIPAVNSDCVLHNINLMVSLMDGVCVFEWYEMDFMLLSLISGFKTSLLR
jgi:hypothetical protein